MTNPPSQQEPACHDDDDSSSVERPPPFPPAAAVTKAGEKEEAGTSSTTPAASRAPTTAAPQRRMILLQELLQTLSDEAFEDLVQQERQRRQQGTDRIHDDHDDHPSFSETRKRPPPADPHNNNNNTNTTTMAVKRPRGRPPNVAAATAVGGRFVPILPAGVPPPPLPPPPPPPRTTTIKTPAAAKRPRGRSSKKVTAATTAAANVDTTTTMRNGLVPILPAPTTVPHHHNPIPPPPPAARRIMARWMAKPAAHFGDAWWKAFGTWQQQQQTTATTIRQEEQLMSDMRTWCRQQDATALRFVQRQHQGPARTVRRLYLLYQAGFFMAPSDGTSSSTSSSSLSPTAPCDMGKALHDQVVQDEASLPHPPVAVVPAPVPTANHYPYIPIAPAPPAQEQPQQEPSPLDETDDDTTIDEAWMTQYRKLQAYQQEHGDCHVPPDYADPALYKYVQSMRKYFRQYLKVQQEEQQQQQQQQQPQVAAANTCNTDQTLAHHKPAPIKRRLTFTHARMLRKIALLEAVGLAHRTAGMTRGGGQVQRHHEAWEQQYAALLDFYRRHGHCDVSPLVHPQHAELGRWCTTQRQAFLKHNNNNNNNNSTTTRSSSSKSTSRKLALTQAQISKLAAIGFRFHRVKNAWEERFAALQAYQEEHGHTRVPVAYTGFRNLGKWCMTQRNARRAGTLPVERFQQLEAIGFHWGPPPQPKRTTV